MSKVYISSLTSDKSQPVSTFFDHCGNLHVSTEDNKQYLVNFDRDNNLVLEKRTINLSFPEKVEYAKLIPHPNSLRKKAEEEEPDDSDEETEGNYFPEDNEYSTNFDPYDDISVGFFGTEHVDLTDEQVRFTAISEDTKLIVLTDPENDHLSLYETIIYNNGAVQFKSCLINMIPMFRLIWYLDSNRFDFRPTGCPIKSFHLQYSDDDLHMIPIKIGI